MSLLHSGGKQGNKGNKRTGEQREPGNRGTKKQGNKGRRNCDFVYKLLMQNFFFRIHVGNMSFDVWRKGHVDAHAP